MYQYQKKEVKVCTNVIWFLFIIKTISSQLNFCCCVIKKIVNINSKYIISKRKVTMNIYSHSKV